MTISNRSITNEQTTEFRRATEQDFDALFDIWMQDHINPFMSFEKMSREQFRQAIFPQLLTNRSQIYVLTVDGKIAAARQLVYGTNEKSHIAELNSFGVHKDYLKLGLGRLMFTSIKDLIKKEKPEICYIEISQEMDNDIALDLAKKVGFFVETQFPDWFIRSTGTHENEWYTGERFLKYTIKPTATSTPQVSTYTAELPKLKSSYQQMEGEKISRQNNTVFYRQGEKMLITCELDPGIWRYSHIEFLQSITVSPDCSAETLQHFFRLLVTEEAKKFKKIEIFSHHHNVLNATAAEGFHCRGKTTSSYKNVAENTYHDEVGADISFFNIDDAINFIEKYALKYASDQKNKVLRKLTTSEAAITTLYQQNEIDQYGYLYLKNLAYQIVANTLGKNPCYTNENAPWEKLVRQLPSSLANCFRELAKSLDLKFADVHAMKWNQTAVKFSAVAGLLFYSKNPVAENKSKEENAVRLTF